MDSSVLETLVIACVFLMLPSVFLAQNSPDDFVNAHNDVRGTVGLPCLVWNTTLQEYAQSYANKRSLDCLLRRSGAPGYGENLFIGTPNNYSARDAVNAWAAERPYYNYDTNTCMTGRVCGHYTQLVWNTTTSVGCARVPCVNGSVFMTCNYYLAGNVIGRRPY
ncbi:pathogenesis-related protein PRB1-2-like [Vitis riparia]|uniref:pathogenesis-related protein PRB1-2-like n=1 Tax=Vitis riparia TaxID=96939 RepID=UPI00155B2DA5|nr:pathogenesis-related protein PRB1-2-like [Vitis riparia]